MERSDISKPFSGKKLQLSLLKVDLKKTANIQLFEKKKEEGFKGKCEGLFIQHLLY